MMDHRGCVCIRTEGLSPEMTTILCSAIISWVYESRGPKDSPGLPHHPVFFVLDDTLEIVRGDGAREASTGTNPVATWAFLGRSRKLGFILSAQNFSLVSPALRNNTDTIICAGSFGRDAKELGSHMNLCFDQTQRLSTLRPGEVIVQARSVWPLAVYGRIPLVP
jgi:hypothetical protein